MEKIKVGVVGVGFIGKQHIDAIRRIPGTEIVALADSHEAQGKSICEELSIPRFYNNHIDLIVNEKPDVIHNCTPNHWHYGICEDAIRHKINVYCEKPLANHSEETEILCKLVQKHNCFAAVNFNYRYNAMIREMHERINSVNTDALEEWGRTFLIRGHYLQDWMMYDTDYNWRCIPELGGASRVIADVGSHWFDTVQYITGKKIVRVFADLETVIKQRKKPAVPTGDFDGRADELVPMVSEDAALIIIEFEDGVKGQLTVSQVSAGNKNNFGISVDGSHYSMTWEQENPDKLWIGHRVTGNIMKYAGPEFLHGNAVRYATLPSGHPAGWSDALTNSIGAFYAAIREESPINYATFEDASYIVKIVEACLMSSREGRWVRVADHH